MADKGRYSPYHITFYDIECKRIEAYRRAHAIVDLLNSNDNQIMNYAYATPTQVTKRQVFISFHHKDEQYRDEFNRRWGHAYISRDVKLGDIDAENDADYIKRLIHENHIVNSSVVVALYGAETHGRKHVDWEISAALSDKVGGHKGLVVMLLPTFPASPFNEYGQFDVERIRAYLHPRTADNIANGYADVYFWPGMYSHLPSFPMETIVEAAATKRETHNHLIENSHPQYKANR